MQGGRARGQSRAFGGVERQDHHPGLVKRAFSLGRAGAGLQRCLTPDSRISAGSHVDLALSESLGTDHLSKGEVECGQSGSCGFAVRVVPSHEDAVLPHEMPWIR